MEPQPALGSFDVFGMSNRAMNNLLDSDSENEEYTLLEQHLDSLNGNDDLELTKNQKIVLLSLKREVESAANTSRLTPVILMN